MVRLLQAWVGALCAGEGLWTCVDTLKTGIACMDTGRNVTLENFLRSTFFQTR